MIRKHAMVLTLAFLFLGMIFTSVDTPFVQPNAVQSDIQDSPETIEQIADGPVPQEPLRLNVLENPSFEDWDSAQNEPETWDSLTTAYQHANTTYTGVKNGNYAGLVESRANENSYGSAYLRPILDTTETPLLKSGISLSFNWYVLNNPDLDLNSRFEIYIETRNSTGYSRYLCFY